MVADCRRLDERDHASDDLRRRSRADGVDSPRDSGLLYVAIVGDAVVLLLAGAVADLSSIAGALIVPAACYMVIAVFGWHARLLAQPYMH